VAAPHCPLYYHIFQDGRENKDVKVVAAYNKKIKFSHTGYRALSPELIPVYRQSAPR